MRNENSSPHRPVFSQFVNSLLTTGLRFIGYVGIDKFLPFFKNLHFFDFHSKKCSFKANTSPDKFFLFWRKQIMSINQAYDRLYSDKVSKF